MIKAPKLRFKEFSEDWEQKKFKDIYNVKSGYGFKLNEYSSTGIPLIKILNCIIKSDKYINKKRHL